MYFIIPFKIQDKLETLPSFVKEFFYDYAKLKRKSDGKIVYRILLDRELNEKQKNELLSSLKRKRNSDKQIYTATLKNAPKIKKTYFYI